MEDYQQRVVEEHDELYGRLAKLVAFFSTPMFASLQQPDRMLMQRQAQVMTEYCGILSARIARFGVMKT